MVDLDDFDFEKYHKASAPVLLLMGDCSEDNEYYTTNVVTLSLIAKCALRGVYDIEPPAEDVNQVVMTLIELHKKTI